MLEQQLANRKRQRIIIDIDVELEIKDKHGKTVKKIRFPSQSYVKNFIAVLRALLRGDTESITKLDGSSDTYYGGHPYHTEIGSNECDNQTLEILNALAGSGDDSYGIVVGSGTTSVSINDYNLASKIAHGTGAGQLNYYGVSISGLTKVNPNTYEFYLERIFENLSGGDVTIAEAGLIVHHRLFYERGNSPLLDKDTKFMIIRDLLPSPETITPESSITIRYYIRITGYYVKNFIAFLKACLEKSSTNITQPDGSTVEIVGANDNHCYSSASGPGTWIFEYRSLYALAGAGDDSYGILVGDGTDNFDVDQYSISKISKSILDPTEHTIEDISVSDPDAWFRLIRWFKNISGSQQTVHEIGLYVKYRLYSHFKYGDNNKDISATFMILRILLGTAITLDPDASLGVKLKFKITVWGD